MEKDANKMFHFYPILLNELKQKIKDKYLNEFENINAKKHLADLHNKTVLTLYKEANDAIIQYTNPTQTMHDTINKDKPNIHKSNRYFESTNCNRRAKEKPINCRN
eukprot:790681_1